MLTEVFSASVYGIDAKPVTVETDVNNGLPGMELVGLLSGEVKEARERVRIAIKNSGYDFPGKKITVNISPASLRKTGTHYDLAIIIGILMNTGAIKDRPLAGICVFGEVSFNGNVNKVKGVLSAVIACKEKGLSTVIVPAANYKEASLIEGMRVVPVNTIKDVVDFLNDGFIPDVKSESGADACAPKETLDFSDVHGQFMAKRAAQICAAGMHNLLLAGPPGAGKSMISRRIPTIMPPLDYEEQIELTRIYSVAGKLCENGLITERPFRDPHHSVSKGALIGGGNNPMPGEITFANNGILFLDEFPEFKRDTIEVLRQPLEDGKIVINRVFGSITYPARFTLVAAMNRCPCGFFPDRNKCRCMPGEIARYVSKISQPLLDRIDLKVDIPAINFEDFGNRIKSESSEIMRNRVLRARQMQKARYKDSDTKYNSRLTSRETEEFCVIPKASKEKIKDLFNTCDFSARAYYRILKTSRTIADLEGFEAIQEKHVNEALMFRLTDLAGIC